MKARATERSPEEETIQVARKRFARRRLTRRLVALRPILVGMAVVAAVTGAVWLLFFSSVLAAEGVQVRGTSVVPDGQVRRLAQVPIGTPLARVDLDAIEARIEDLVAVKSVDVSRSWPHRIRIDVTERLAVAVVDKEGRLKGLDETGILFRDYATRPSGLPLIHMNATTDADALAESAKVVTSLPARLARRVDHLEAVTVDEITLELRGGSTVRWGSAEDSANKARVLAVLLRQQPKAARYDVSVPGNPTVKLG